jgi:hypothetical protein
MSDSVKKRAIAKILCESGPMISQNNPTPAGKVRTITREMDLLKSSEHMPSLMIYDGEEQMVEEDDKGSTWQFPLAVKILFESQRDLAEIKDELVPEVQKVMEQDLQLGRTGELDQRGRRTAVHCAEVGKPVGGALIHYEVEYRRMRGIRIEATNL